jgi:GntP family gluconate:H+ symporter
MAHSLVPPTPGPLFVAEELGVDMGLMMMAGTIVGVATLLVGYLWAVLVTRKGVLELPPGTEVVTNVNRTLPSLWLSLLPILIPVVLICR